MSSSNDVILLCLSHVITNWARWKKHQQMWTYFDRESWLIISSCCKDLRLYRGYNGVPSNELGHDSTECLYAHRQRIDIEKHKVICVFLTTQYTSMHCCTICHCFVGIDSSAWLLQLPTNLTSMIYAQLQLSLMSWNNFVAFVLYSVHISQ